ncbi:MAG: PQQ-dependent sugar dehydrogenase [Thaumarchaeota archaeon]|nr:MAG: PQQ-dependent sugar dehydrogenase [Nitrososphaerota archaeon]
MILFLAVICLFFHADAASAEVKVETVVDNLKIPWELVFAPDGRIFFTERDGKLWVIEDESLELVATFPTSNTLEGGLLGLALDPEFEKNNFLYLYQTYFGFELHHNKVVRYTVSNNQLTDEQILIDKIPGALWHDGGRIKFGPDEKIYITTGDAANANLSQKIDSLAGKILRINADGTIPVDNPFESSPVFSYGHRNPQGIDWTENGILVSSEHGPSGEKGYAHDEINVIEPGKNYGWPVIVGDSNNPEYTNPILHSGDVTWAPSGLLYYDSDKIPELKGKFLVAALRGQHVMVLDLDLKNNSVNSVEKIFQDKYGRIRDLVQSPDGDVFILTSNGDNDKILRVTTLETPPLTVETKGPSSSLGGYLVYGIIIATVVAGAAILIKRRKK